jgi:hypothetical protein
MNLLVFFIGVVVLGGVAIVLGTKFFDTSVRQEEHHKGWNE